MAAFRLNLQKSLFQQDGERLLGLATIKRDSKRKKEAFLCLAVTITQPVAVWVYIVKLLEREETFVKKEQFALRDLRVVDGPVTELILTIRNNVYHLDSNTHEEKEFLIRQIFKLSNAYLPVQKPEFINVSLPVDTMLPKGANSHDSGEVESKNIEMDSNYQPITQKEEADFRRLLSKSNLHIGQAKQFAAVLGEQLAQLDTANLSSIMDNKQNVGELIELVDTAIELAECIERQLDEYDTLLSFVRDSVELIEEKDGLRHIEQQNNRRLHVELKDFVYLMEMVQEQHIDALKSANLSDPTGINSCCQAARVVEHFLSQKTELNGMKAYQTKVDLLNKLTADFIDKFYAHICTIFCNMDSMLESQHIGDIIMQKHSQRHRALLPFSDLIAWLKQARPAIYAKTMERYKREARKLYKSEFDRFFSELSRHAVQTVQNESFNGGTHSLTASNNDIPSLKAYTDLIETAVAECRTVVESEQKFSIRFFHLNMDVLTQFGAEPSNNHRDSKKTVEKQLNDQIKFAIGDLFDALPTYFYVLVSTFKDQHLTIVMSLYVALSKRLSAFTDSTSFFSTLYGSFLIALKRLFDEQMSQIEDSFANVRSVKKSRVGILDSIGQFKSIALMAVSIFGEFERRTDLDKWLEKLADAILKGIEVAAEAPTSKYPTAIVKVENLHAFYSTLSEMKLSCLDSRRKSARLFYQENLSIYVRESMGRPLDKIHMFFERVERHLENGAKPEEISYEQQFSRMELKRAISAYPAKEVKKGLESLYRKAEKHLCPHSPLLVVVCRQMQEEFLRQVKNYQELISRCYPNSKIELDFSIGDVLQFFSEIAQQH
uniref:Sec3-PIP2_bind domain-containing protein n=1 Tax=Globodera pallida TaxID=36090 RepID=A0A183BTI0_GLOPA